MEFSDEDIGINANAKPPQEFSDADIGLGPSGSILKSPIEPDIASLLSKDLTPPVLGALTRSRPGRLVTTGYGAPVNVSATQALASSAIRGFYGDDASESDNRIFELKKQIDLNNAKLQQIELSTSRPTSIGREPIGSQLNVDIESRKREFEKISNQNELNKQQLSAEIENNKRLGSIMAKAQGNTSGYNAFTQATQEENGTFGERTKGILNALTEGNGVIDSASNVISIGAQAATESAWPMAKTMALSMIPVVGQTAGAISGGKDTYDQKKSEIINKWLNDNGVDPYNTDQKLAFIDSHKDEFAAIEEKAGDTALRTGVAQGAAQRVGAVLEGGAKAAGVPFRVAGGKGAAKAFAKGVGSTLKAGGAEFLQETAQEGLENLASTIAENKTLDLNYSSLLGQTALGGLAGGVSGLSMHIPGSIGRGINSLIDPNYRKSQIEYDLANIISGAIKDQQDELDKVIAKQRATGSGYNESMLPPQPAQPAPAQQPPPPAAGAAPAPAQAPTPTPVDPAAAQPTTGPAVEEPSIAGEVPPLNQPKPVTPQAPVVDTQPAAQPTAQTAATPTAQTAAQTAPVAPAPTTVAEQVAQPVQPARPAPAAKKPRKLGSAAYEQRFDERKKAIQNAKTEEEVFSILKEQYADKEHNIVDSEEITDRVAKPIVDGFRKTKAEIDAAAAQAAEQKPAPTIAQEVSQPEAAKPTVKPAKKVAGANQPFVPSIEEDQLEEVDVKKPDQYEFTAPGKGFKENEVKVKRLKGMWGAYEITSKNGQKVIRNYGWLVNYYPKLSKKFKPQIDKDREVESQANPVETTSPAAAPASQAAVPAELQKRLDVWKAKFNSVKDLTELWKVAKEITAKVVKSKLDKGDHYDHVQKEMRAAAYAAKARIQAKNLAESIDEKKKEIEIQKAVVQEAREQEAMYDDAPKQTKIANKENAKLDELKNRLRQLESQAAKLANKETDEPAQTEKPKKNKLSKEDQTKVDDIKFAAESAIDDMESDGYEEFDPTALENRRRAPGINKDSSAQDSSLLSSYVNFGAALLKDGDSEEEVRSRLMAKGAFGTNNIDQIMEDAKKYSSYDISVLADETSKSVSTRIPYQKGEQTEDAGRNLIIGLPQVMSNPVMLAKMVERIKNVPGFKFNPSDTDEQVMEKFVSHAEANILWLHDNSDPDVIKRSKLWYVGANILAKVLSKKHNISHEQAAAIIAVLSPQMDWFKNLSLAKRLCDALIERQSHVIDSKIIAALKSRPAIARIALREFRPNLKYPKKLKDKNDKAIPYTEEQNAYIKKLDAIARKCVDQWNLKGKKISQIKNKALKAIVVRGYDEAYNEKTYDLTSPEGDLLGPVMNDAGTKTKKIGWGSFGTIRKVMSILEDGSLSNISDQLGNEHKVRNFYNNIIDPESKLGEVTIDTHAVAAATLLPLSGKSQIVKDNLGSGGGSAQTGVSGTYPIYAEAYRRAAKKRGLLPREMQSITWEAVKGLYTDKYKSNKSNGKYIESIWNEHKRGDITADQARERISSAAGGIKKPGWTGRGLTGTQGAGAGTQSSELAGPPMGRGTGDTDTGATGRSARGPEAGPDVQGTDEPGVSRSERRAPGRYPELTPREIAKIEAKAAELDRRARERSRRDEANRDPATRRRGAEQIAQRIANELRRGGNLSFEQIMALLKPLERIREYGFLDDLAVSLQKEDKGRGALGQYNAYTRIITIFANAASSTEVLKRTWIHEFAHHLERFLPEKDIQALRQSLKRARAKFLKGKAVLSKLMGDGDWTKFSININELKAMLKTMESTGQIKSADAEFNELMKWLSYDSTTRNFGFAYTDDTYRFTNTSEWWAENVALIANSIEDSSVNPHEDISLFRRTKDVLISLKNALVEAFGGRVVERLWRQFNSGAINPEMIRESMASQGDVKTEGYIKPNREGNMNQRSEPGMGDSENMPIPGGRREAFFKSKEGQDPVPKAVKWWYDVGHVEGRNDDPAKVWLWAMDRTGKVRVLNLNDLQNNYGNLFNTHLDWEELINNGHMNGPEDLLNGPAHGRVDANEDTVRVSLIGKIKGDVILRNMIKEQLSAELGLPEKGMRGYDFTDTGISGGPEIFNQRTEPGMGDSENMPIPGGLREKLLKSKEGQEPVMKPIRFVTDIGHTEDTNPESGYLWAMDKTGNFLMANLKDLMDSAAENGIELEDGLITHTVWQQMIDDGIVPGNRGLLSGAAHGRLQTGDVNRMSIVGHNLKDQSHIDLRETVKYYLEREIKGKNKNIKGYDFTNLHPWDPSPEVFNRRTKPGMGPNTPKGEPANHDNADLADRGFITNTAAKLLPEEFLVRKSEFQGGWLETKSTAGSNDVTITVNDGRRAGFLTYMLTDSSDGGPQTEAHVEQINIDDKYRGLKLSEVLYAEAGERLRRKGIKLLTGKVVDQMQRPIKARNAVFGNTEITSTDKFGSEETGGDPETHRWVQSNIDPNMPLNQRSEPGMGPKPVVRTNEDGTKEYPIGSDYEYTKGGKGNQKLQVQRPHSRDQIDPSNIESSTVNMLSEGSPERQKQIAEWVKDSEIKVPVFRGNSSPYETHDYELSGDGLMHMTFNPDYASDYTDGDARISFDREQTGTKAALIKGYLRAKYIIDVDDLGYRVYRDNVNLFADRFVQAAQNSNPMLSEEGSSELRKDVMDLLTEPFEQSSLPGTTTESYNFHEILGTDMILTLFEDVGIDAIVYRDSGDNYTDWSSPRKREIKMGVKSVVISDRSRFKSSFGSNNVDADSDNMFESRRREPVTSQADAALMSDIATQSVSTNENVAKLLDKWAANTLKPGRMLTVGPNVIAAMVWMTAREIIRTGVDFVKWSAEMVKKFGSALKNVSLKGMWDEAKKLAKSGNLTEFPPYRFFMSVADRAWQNTDRFPGSPTLRKMAGLIMTRTGPDAEAEATDIPSRIMNVRIQFGNMYAEIMEKFALEFAQMNKDERRQWDIDFYDYVVGRKTPPSKKLENAVAEYRAMMKQALAYQRAVGADIGDVGPGFITRRVDPASVEEDTEGFAQAAAVSYEQRNERLRQEALDELAKTMATKWEELKKADQKRIADPNNPRKNLNTDQEYQQAAKLWEQDQLDKISMEFDKTPDDFEKMGYAWANAVMNGEVAESELGQSPSIQENTNSTKARTFNDDEALAFDAFVVKDIDELTIGYVRGMVARTEIARAFGADKAGFTTMINQMRQEGVDTETIKEMHMLMNKAVGLGSEFVSASGATVSDWFNIVIASVYLGKSFAYNLILEPFAFGIRTNMYFASRGLASTWINLAKGLVRPDPAQQQMIIAKYGSMDAFNKRFNETLGEHLGLIQSDIARQFIDSHWNYMSQRGGSKVAQWLAQRIYRSNLMASSERAKIEASISVARMAIRDNARWLLNVHPTQKLFSSVGMDASAPASSASIMNELGVPEADHESFSNFVVSLDSMDEKSAQAAVMKAGDRNAIFYRQAVQRLSMGTSIKANPALRMASADTAAGRMMMQLMNYSYAFYSQVTTYAYRSLRAALTKGDLSKADRVRYIAPIVGAIMTAMAAYGTKELNGIIDPSSGTRKRDKSSVQSKALEAIAFAGMLPPPIEMIIKSVTKGQLPGGPATEAFARVGEKVYNATAGKGTEAAKRAAVEQAVELGLKPAIIAGASAISKPLGFFANVMTQNEYFTKNIADAVTGKEKPLDGLP